MIALAAALSTAQAGTMVRYQTMFGKIDVELYDTQTPNTVANFLHYLDSGYYKDTHFHRYVPGFVLQGGGYYYDDQGEVVEIPTIDPVANEPGISNTSGTLAMAKVSGDPDSATSQWFFNLNDNSGNDPNSPGYDDELGYNPDGLDYQNEGFTVFGKVVNGMDVLGAFEYYYYYRNDDRGINFITDDEGNQLSDRPFWYDAQSSYYLLTDITRLPGQYGDTDGNGDVDLGDLTALGQGWAPSGGDVDWENGDFDGDGDVDATDLAWLGMNWTGTQQTEPTPEPASLSLLALGGLALLRRKRK
jgi:cyclophilin family peptidyl-prolyl cis-trans isomerase